MLPITLDASIRDWVLVPLILIVLFVQIARAYLLKLVQTKNKANVEVLAQKAVVGRSGLLRQHGAMITSSGFYQRKQWLVGSSGVLLEKPEAPFQNPMSMLDQMKSQMVFMATNYGMGYWTQTFFAGFLLVKLPFMLTNRFKVMTQQGIALAGLDPSYVSSLSWYMILLWGLRPLVTLFVGADMMAGTSDAAMMQAQMGMMSGGAGAQWNPVAAYKNESTTLKVVQHADLQAGYLSLDASKAAFVAQVRAKL